MTSVTGAFSALPWPMISEHHQALLDFEALWPRDIGAKHEQIRARFGITPVRYYQMLNVVLDDPVALEAQPMEVGRLRRVRDARVNKRANRAFE